MCCSFTYTNNYDSTFSNKMIQMTIWLCAMLKSQQAEVILKSDHHDFKGLSNICEHVFIYNIMQR